MNIVETVKVIGAFIILFGSIIAVVSAIGIIRFPDVYSRAHAATKTTTLAVLITLTGTFVFILVHEAYLSVRIVLGIVFVFLTAPVSGHLVLRAAYRAHVEMSPTTAHDELKNVLHKEKSKS